MDSTITLQQGCNLDSQPAYRAMDGDSPLTTKVCERTAVPTGYASLDALLPQCGWPLGASTELLPGEAGIGEFSLLLPTLARLTRRGGQVLLVNPPWTPFAPALARSGIALDKLWLVHPRGPQDTRWAIEQSLCSGSCAALVSWQGHHTFTVKHLQRLQLAARSGNCLHFHFRPHTESLSPSPAGLRLQLHSDGERLVLERLQQPGVASGQRLYLARAAHPAQSLH
ncbi:translesion DNA synthesis-associated protein ImuA [Microbulbifer sp. 2205BS26-8]|uniref:translesion DNA synthesis-associated protein ImuA n=1 Tax=Microbulbifer sp. 2205BS26-8 TaxID=3064386 RepID=UPI00273E4115|nr:translesion DNA synthesis-associated protein ImuA [Microbulbifer sp. 2205BS26-8]MDP5209002.1 translesion DNA synthesis-associated protein ImuA [Microbulbifer sp. 2205BS26-8]